MPGTKTESVIRSVLFSRRKIAVFSACLFISGLFWLLLALNGNYTTLISVPIRYVNMPKDQLLLEKLPSEAQIELSGIGYQLLAYTLQPHRGEITLDGMQMGISPYKKNGEAFLTTNNAVQVFNRQHIDVVALKILPDTIYFTFFKRGFRKVPVHLNRYINFEKQYGFGDSIRLSPDSISITGPAEVIDSILFVETEPLIINNVSSSGEYLVKVKSLSHELSYAPSKISVTLSVEKFTESVIEVPVQIEHLMSRDSIQIFPESIKIKFVVSLRDYKNATPESFGVAVDAYDLRNNHAGKLRLYLRKYPTFVSNIKLEPEVIDFIIRKKK
jgi:hypothetical protein